MSRQGNQTEIARYLLGSLSEEERATLEEKYFSDDTAFEEMQIAEEELIDQYVRAELSNEDRARFAAMVARSPRLAERVEFARVWKDKLSGPVRSAAIIEDASKPVATVHPFLSKSKFSTRNLALAASVIVLIGVLGVWRLFIYEPPIERGLVALQTAYREHRPVEARLSGFNYAPLPNERGSNVKVDSLQRDLAGTLLISQAVQSPNAQSRHAVGQYYLYERQFSKAIEELTEALTQDPNNARIHSDLGAALLEEGKRQRSGAEQGTEFETFGRSLSHLTKAIEIDESLLEARFNLAMLYQNMMPTQEANAWREYLKRDNTSAWAEEAKRNLARLEGNAIERSWDSGASLTEYVNATESKDDDTAWKIISQSYTSGGNEVTNRLLDSLFEDPTNEESENKIRDWLSYVAQLEAAHSGDRFTVDLVRTYEEASPKEKGLLAAARGHMRTGYTLFTQSRFKDAIKEYEQAKKYYQLCNDQSGVALSTYRIAHCHILLPNLSLAHAMTDNVFRRQLWPMFGTGVRVLGISDSCRSGTVLYTLALNLANTPGLFLDDSVVAEIRGTNPFARTSVTLVEDRIKVRFHELPSYQVEAHYHQESAFYSSIREALPKDPPPLEAKLLTLSACADDEVTADGPENSAFTAALLKVWNNGSFQGNYDKFLEAIGAELPNQTPQRNPKAPNVDMNFVNQRPFTI